MFGFTKGSKYVVEQVKKQAAFSGKAVIHPTRIVIQCARKSPLLKIFTGH